MGRAVQSGFGLRGVFDKINKLAIVDIMDTITVRATDLKNRTSEVINWVFYKNKDVLVERYGRPVVKIIACSDGVETEKRDLQKVLDRYYGAIPNIKAPRRSKRTRYPDLKL